jgi:hypothetical protein
MLYSRMNQGFDVKSADREQTTSRIVLTNEQNHAKRMYLISRPKTQCAAKTGEVAINAEPTLIEVVRIPDMIGRQSKSGDECRKDWIFLHVGQGLCENPC